MKVLVTGSEGNIGSRLIPHLKKCGHSVYRIDIKQSYADDYTLADVTKIGDMYGIFLKFRPDVVIHMAAMVSRITCERSPDITVDVNISGTNNVIQLCKDIGAKIIYFSTSEIYGNIGGFLTEDRVPIPNNRYALTKYLGEKLIEYEKDNYGLKAVILRPFMFYDEYESFGENRSAMIRFAENLILGNKIEVHKGSHRSWMHISDAVIAIEKSIHLENEVINIGSNDVLPIEVIVQKMCDILSLNYQDCVKETEFPSRMTFDKYPDLKKYDRLIGHVPQISIDTGIRNVLNVVKQRLSHDL